MFGLSVPATVSIVGFVLLLILLTLGLCKAASDADDAMDEWQRRTYG